MKKQTSITKISYSSHDSNLIINFLTGFIYNTKQYPIMHDGRHKV